ncbi:MAG: hypothetical protein V3T83_18900 [Acidobacteriota bacterium]
MIRTVLLAVSFVISQGAGSAPEPSASPELQQTLFPSGLAVLQAQQTCRPVNLLDSPEAIRKAGFRLELQALAAPPIEPCPNVFSDCEDQPGRRCRETDCSTTDTGNKRCQQPDGTVLKCTGNQSIHVTACGCTAGPTLICCFDESCGFECGLCGSGSQTIFCQ